MTIAQQLIDKMTGRVTTANPITYAHDIGGEVFDLQVNNKVLRFQFSDNSQAFLIKSGMVWIGETL